MQGVCSRSKYAPAFGIWIARAFSSDTVCCNVLQCVAVCCSVLECVAVCCGVLQCVAVWCRVFVLDPIMHQLSEFESLEHFQVMQCVVMFLKLSFEKFKKSDNAFRYCYSVPSSMWQRIKFNDSFQRFSKISICCVYGLHGWWLLRIFNISGAFTQYVAAH